MPLALDDFGAMISKLVNGLTEDMPGLDPEKPEPLKVADFDQIKKLRDEARAIRRFFEPQWFLNRAHDLGNQSAEWSQQSRRIRVVAAERTRICVNKIRPRNQRWVAKLLRNRPTLQAVPTNPGEDSDKEQAKIAEVWIDELLTRMKFLETMARALYWMRLEGKSYLHFYWDSFLGDPEPATVPNTTEDGFFPYWPADQDGNAIGGQEYLNPYQIPVEVLEAQQAVLRPGEVAVDIWPVHEILPSPGSETLEECKWFIHERVRAIEDLKDDPAYEPGRIAMLKPESLESFDDTEALVGTATTARPYYGYKQGDRRSSETPSVILHRYFEKPCKKYPNGREIVWAGDVILRVSGLPIEIGQIPAVELTEQITPGRFYATSTTEQMLPSQHGYNVGISQVTEHLKQLAIGVLKYQRGAVKQKPTMAAGEHIETEPGRGDVQRMEVGSLPASVQDSLSRFVTDLDEISGQHETTRGVASSDVTSGRHAEVLLEQDDTFLGPVVNIIERAFGEGGRWCLKIARKQYKEDRIVRVIGQDLSVSLFKVSEAMFGSIYDFRVVPDSAIPRSKASRKAEIRENWIAGLYGDPALDEVRRNVARLMGAADAATIVQDMEVDTHVAREESEQLLLHQAPPETNPWDNDQVHIEQHTKDIKSSRFRSVNIEIREALWAHVQEHVAQVEAKKAPMPGPIAEEPPIPPMDEALPLEGDMGFPTAPIAEPEVELPPSPLVGGVLPGAAQGLPAGIQDQLTSF